MVGVARTVKCTKRNDFLAVLRGLMEAQDENEVLIVDTSDSNRAVAGELFCTQAEQKGLSGIVVDGPVRDTQAIQQLTWMRCYASSVTPYAGTTLSPGQMQTSVVCGGIRIQPGEIVVGDNDGIIVASSATFKELLPHAKAIQEAEAKIHARLLEGENLSSMTNYEEHLKAWLALEPSSLEFRI